MKTNGIGRWIGLAVCLWAATSFAEEAQDPIVLTVLGTNYTAKELGVEADASPDLLVARTFLKIQSGIMGAYFENLNYQPSEEELKEYCRRSAPTPEEMNDIFGRDRPFPLSTEELFQNFWQDWQRDATNEHGFKQNATEQLTEWKFNQSLFNQYGGRVRVDAIRSPGASDAACAYLADREAAGDFSIRDAELRDRYWNLMRTSAPVQLVSEEEGRAALAEHPADRQKRQAVQELKEYLQQASTQISDAEPPDPLDETALP